MRSDEGGHSSPADRRAPIAVGVSRTLETELSPNGAVQDAALDQTVPDSSALACSAGIMAYNEEANIASAIETILGQPLVSGQITELIVVTSGCTDRTATIVAEIARNDSRVRLIEQEQREGKASAINLFIGTAQSPILMMVGADVLVKEGTIDALLRHLQDPAVGMVGGHPVPVNDETTFLGHAVHLLWRLHDRVARRSPKLGEIVAFRNVVPSIPLDTPVDEISIEALITQLGYQLVYEPKAIVYNSGPTTLGDFLRQRRRIYAGHLRVRKQQGYAASTMSVWRIGCALLGSGSFSTPRAAWRTICTIGLEAVARGLGHYDSIRRRTHHVWQTATTSKRQLTEEANADSQQNVLVFHILNIQQHQLELGLRASRQLAQRVMRQIQQALGSNAVVSVQRGGTVIALLPGDREQAEGTARQLVQRLEETPLRLNRQRDHASVKLAYGIVTFSPAEQPVATSISGLTPDEELPVLAARLGA